MAMTEAQRRANRKWDSAHYTTMAYKVRKERADAFRAATKAAGTTPNAIFSAAADAFMQEHGGWDAWMPAAPEAEDTTRED